MSDTRKSTPVPPRQGKRNGPPGARAGSSQKPPAGRNRRGRAGQARHRNHLLAAGAVGVVIVVVAALIGVKLSSGSTTSTTARNPAPASLVAKLAGIPLSTLVDASHKVPALEAAQPISTPPLRSAGKPQLLFIGAEFCPICATERWPMVIALSKFGTFSNLSETHSALSDGDIPTLTFYGSRYTSQYLTFTPFESTTNQPYNGFYKPLQTPPAYAVKLWQKLEPNGQEAWPFLDLGGKLALLTAQLPPQLLEGPSRATIEGSIGNNATPIGAYIDASAAALTKDICTMTGQQPGAVCSAVAHVNIPAANSGSSSSSPSSAGG